MSVQPPPIPQPAWVQSRQKIDAEHLRLLAVFYYVMAGLSVVGLLFIAGHYAVMHTVFGNPEMWKNSKDGPPPEDLLKAFQGMYVFFAGVCIVGGVINFLSGRYLMQKKNRMFSMVVAGLNCLNMPLGMILGVFTFVVLLRPSVQALYEESA